LDENALGYVQGGDSDEGIESTLSFASPFNGEDERKGYNLTAPATEDSFGANSVQAPNGQDNQIFTFKFLADEDESYGVWKIKSKSRGQYIQVNANNADGTAIKLGGGSNHFTTFHIVYNMSSSLYGSRPGYFIISVSSYTGDETAGGKYNSKGSKHGFRAIDLTYGKADAEIKLYGCYLHETSQNRLWYFQPPVNVKITDTFTNGAANQENTVPLPFNAQVNSSSEGCLKTYAGYSFS
jgi:hypothetical protein